MLPGVGLPFQGLQDFSRVYSGRSKTGRAHLRLAQTLQKIFSDPRSELLRLIPLQEVDTYRRHHYSRSGGPNPQLGGDLSSHDQVWYDSAQLKEKSIKYFISGLSKSWTKYLI
jgi:hypothetical protein